MALEAVFLWEIDMRLCREIIFNQLLDDLYWLGKSGFKPVGNTIVVRTKHHPVITFKRKNRFVKAIVNF